MNASRYAALARGLSGIQRKVMEVVPLRDEWTVAQVCAEVARSGSTPDFRSVACVLHHLASTGLIREPTRGKFTRSERKTPDAVLHATNPTPPPNPTKEAAPMSKAKTTTAPAPMARLSAVADKLRALGELASEIDEAVLAYEENMQATQAGAAKLKQLQELLKGMAG